MDGLQCKRCKSPDTFEVLCDDCQKEVFDRTDCLIERSKDSKEKAETYCTKLGETAIKILISLGDDVTEDELFGAFRRRFGHWAPEKFSSCLQLIKLEDEREGYAELAELSCRIFFDENYLEQQILGSLAELAKAEQTQDWRNQ